jgi:hypothetical protein
VSTIRRNLTIPARTLPCLRRLAELGGGKILDPDTDNPFSHDRKETFQPLDLRDWLLKLAILLFPLDVAVRRIQIDRAEWLRATKTLRRWLMPWQRRPPHQGGRRIAYPPCWPARGRVRSERTAVAPSPTLFEPEKTSASARAGQARADASGGEPTQASGAGTNRRAKEQPSVTSRLLDAKRRAQKRQDKE